VKLSKKSIREDILAKTQDYLSNGGSIEKISLGESGPNTNEPRVRRVHEIEESSESKMFLNDVVAAVDARKEKTTKAKPLTQNNSRRYKKLIYDDFGEPLREVWVDEIDR
tara:strand:- start:30968 stop:31297 length:330 start_codon:yes stop_codon:yes gene_type:complete